MPTNNFLPFCPTVTGTNLLTQSEYAAAADRTVGNQPGAASSKLNNKAIRQSSAVVSQVAQAISDILTQDVLDDGNMSVLLAQIKLAFQAPIGSVISFAGASAPTGWLLCNGSSLLRAGTYAGLFAILGTTWGSADGTHFTVPDLRGVFVRGAGTSGVLTNANAVAFAGTLGAYQNDRFQSHYHTIVDPAHTHTTTFWQGTVGGGGGPVAESSLVNSIGVVSASSFTGITATAPITDGSNGTPRAATETNPANASMNYIIKY